VKLLDTDGFSAQMRERGVDLARQRLRVTNFHGTQQETDLSEPANAHGFGRVRHFRRATSPGWPPNPLPLDPACRALGLPRTDLLQAQVFQNAVCNWRCWYCFVPFALLSGNERFSQWLGAADLVELYRDQPEPPPMIDLTGGQPDLVPEWVPWMMAELERRGLDRSVYLWSDDNLSNDYFWRFLSEADQRRVAAYPCYGRVCCFKGFDDASFSFNTRASPLLFERQFDLMARLLTLGLDLYAYVTLTTPQPDGIEDGVRRFMDRLQRLDENLPLRTVPLEVQVFAPVQPRLTTEHRAALDHQQAAIAVWQNEIQARFSAEKQLLSAADVPLKERVA
jgi:uncharacterized Fe-S cluster-containing radical SAM superfamily protein